VADGERMNLPGKGGAYAPASQLRATTAGIARDERDRGVVIAVKLGRARPG
jgi:hypothetical protein